MDIYEEIDRFLEENLGEVSITDTAKHFFKLGQTHPNWISVEDELPKEKGAYLFHFDDGQTRVEGYFPELHLSKCVTHWMPIVPPRKEDNK